MSAIKVLYAEDDLSNRKMMEHKLSKAGMNCTAVSNGDDAVAKFKESPFDLVILDRLMPNKNDGIEALIQIRKTNSKIPAMCLTCDDWDIDELKEKGFDSVYIKPIIGDKFFEEIKRLCKK